MLEKVLGTGNELSGIRVWRAGPFSKHTLELQISSFDFDILYLFFKFFVFIFMYKKREKKSFDISMTDIILSVIGIFKSFNPDGNQIFLNKYRAIRIRDKS